MFQTKHKKELTETQNLMRMSQSFFHQGNVSDTMEVLCHTKRKNKADGMSQSFFHQGNVSDEAEGKLIWNVKYGKVAILFSSRQCFRR